MLVVNLFGAPGAGKSTGAAYIFSMLKLANVNAELITEFAKDKVWEGNKEIFKPDNQLYMFGKQFYRMSRCRDKVDVLVCDSPLLITVYYNKSEVLGEKFNDVVMDVFNSFDNMNYFITRDKPYNPKGRHQTEEEADAILGPIKDVLDTRDIPYKMYPGNQRSYDIIAEEVLRRLDEDVCD